MNIVPDTSSTEPTGFSTCPQLGLCCKFEAQPIHYRTFTASSLAGLSLDDRYHKISEVCMHNVEMLAASIKACKHLGISCFRIGSDLFPRMTHPEFGYLLEELPDGQSIVHMLTEARINARKSGLRLTLHPDQFVVMNSPHNQVVKKSFAELLYHLSLAQQTGADVINIHGGGAYGDKDSALERLETNLSALPQNLLALLTLENDDRTYTPSDLLPVCKKLNIPLVYDVHHHRCNPDGLSVEQATRMVLETWDRKPLFHISSPRDGWAGKNPRPHHDLIQHSDWPTCWNTLDVTIEVEAKLKEVAVAQLSCDLARNQ